MLHPLIKHEAQKFYVASSLRCVSLLPRSSSPLLAGKRVRHSTSWIQNSPAEPPPLITSSDTSKVVLGTCEKEKGSSEELRRGETGPGTEQPATPTQHQEEISTNIGGLEGVEVKPLDQDRVFSIHSNVLEALQHGQSYKLLHAFLQASKDPNYLRLLPVTTLKEILRSIDPKDFLGPFRAVHQDLGEDSSYISYLDQDFRPLHKIFHEYNRWVHVLLSGWRESGHKFGLAEYTMLLNFARTTGHGETALRVFNAMQADRIAPNTTCYNYFFEARCWSNAYNPYEKYKLRVIPYHLEQRQSARRKFGFLGHRTGFRGIRTEIIENFDFMVKSGVKPDVNTFRMLIQAMGREGDLEGVQSVLKQVWDVDLESALKEEDTALLFENRLSPNSPTYPNKDLLFTIAHIFGSNNQLPAALRVIDIFSRKYDVEIDFETWNQLFQWTFVLSSKHTGSHKRGGADAGQLPLKSVENLWNTMTSEPYNIKPTMHMYNRYVKNMVIRQMLDSVLKLMRAGRVLHQAQERTLEELLAKIHEAESTRFQEETFAEPEAGSVIWELQRQLEIEKLKLYRDYVMICRWVRLLMGGRRWISSKNEMRLGWERIRIPNAVQEFWDYRPETGFSYWTMTCEIRFHRSHPAEMVIGSTNGILPGVMVVQDTERCRLMPLNGPGKFGMLERQILTNGPKIARADGTTKVFEVLE